MTPEQLAEIRARAEAATPGPWMVRGEGSMAFLRQSRGADMQFVAHARTDIPALLDYIEELEARLPLRIEALENALAAVNALRGVEPTNA